MAGGGKAKKQDKAPPAGGEGADGAAPEGDKKKLAGKKLVLFVILPALLVLGAGGGAAMMLLKPGADAHQEGEQHAGKDKDAEKDHGKAKGKDGHGAEAGGGAFTVTEGEGVYFITLPEIFVNITTVDGGAAHLKLKLTLEAADESVLLALEPAMPRVMDQFQTFLRELRTDDLAGSGGAYRVRLELMRRVNLVIAPARIDAVLVEEMLIQ